MKFILNKTQNIFHNKEKVKSLSEFVEAIDKAEDLIDDDGITDVWFRGNSQISYKLVPNQFRTPCKYSPEDESSSLTQFIHKAKAFINGGREHSSMWDWIIAAQHYGMSTRLLDWSEGALIALFFSIENKESRSPCVWVLNPFKLNELSTGKELIYYTDKITRDGDDKQILAKYKLGSKFLPKHPIAIFPPYIDARLKSQKGCFTIHGKNKLAIHELNKTSKVPFLVRIDINPNSIKRIRWQLSVIGINTSDIYPDLPGLAQQQMWKKSVFE
ncbi:FRG domain-containing protein [Thalassotalea sp. PP2-459]|uniref:FRG domain-containing protein n=1 Tax=Thalassotalea sp. PP2-459 TaxID=1742724 RepID=UPI000944F62F|nr:FRG domain-containing protein [Thalassotalea sp. PP2-459]OKY27194.1 hypothetical protein BI291_09705 [Thalassotalea sp. PP2-459]